MQYTFFPLGDQGIIIELGKDIASHTHQKVQLISAHLQMHPPEWMVEFIPSFTTVTIFYHPTKIAQLTKGKKLPYSFVSDALEQLLTNLKDDSPYKSSTIEIPVCYGDSYGPDLEIVARLNNRTPEEVIQIHTSRTYLVYMIGFAPGFPYLGGMSEEIAAPRKATPRLKIPAQSVGIAGKQTGIYPLETPGGWQIIGRTPLSLFRPNEDPPTLINAGDQIKFRAISAEEFREREAKEKRCLQS